MTSQLVGWRLKSPASVVYSTVYPGADQRKHQSPASLAFVRGIHQGPVNSPHKWPVTRKLFPFDDVIMTYIDIICWKITYSTSCSRLPGDVFNINGHVGDWYHHTASLAYSIGESVTVIDTSQTDSIFWQTEIICWLCVLAIFQMYPSSISWLLMLSHTYTMMHDDVIKWTHFPRYWPFVWGIHRSPVNSPHKGQWRGALVFSLIYVWINGWVNNGEAGDLRRYRAHYDVIIMDILFSMCISGILWPHGHISHIQFRLLQNGGYFVLTTICWRA